MRFVLSAALKNLRRQRRDPYAVALWLGVPLVITLLLSLVFGRGGSGGAPRGRLLVADEDKTLLSSLLPSAFSQGELGRMVEVEKVVDRQEGRARIARGDGSALLIIPKGFGAAVLRNEPCRLDLITNPSLRILPSIIEESLSMMAEAVFYLQSLAGDQLKLFSSGPPEEATVAEQARTLNRLGKQVQRYLDPLLIELKTTVLEEETRARFNFAEAFFPGTLFLTLMFLGQAQGAEMWKEREGGTLRRLMTTPRSVGQFLGGAVLSSGALIGLLAVCALTAARWVLGLQVRNWIPAVVWMILAGVALFLLMLLVQIHASSARTGNLLASATLFPLVMLGGSLFPFEVMPEGLAAIGRLTPNGFGVAQLKAILTGTVEPLRLAAGFVGVLLWSALTFALAARRLRRGFLNG